MSPAMSALSSVGITHQMLILTVLALVAAAVIGMYWQIIVPGAIIVVVGSLFINFTPSDTKPEVKIESKEVEVFDERAAFMKDCMEVAEYKMYQCENLWKGHQAEESVDKEPISKVKLFDVDNEEYKARRADTMAKPNAVVIHDIIR